MLNSVKILLNPPWDYIKSMFSTICCGVWFISSWINMGIFLLKTNLKEWRSNSAEKDSEKWFSRKVVNFSIRLRREYATSTFHLFDIVQYSTKMYWLNKMRFWIWNQRRKGANIASVFSFEKFNLFYLHSSTH